MTKKVSVVAALAAVVSLGIAGSASAVLLFDSSFDFGPTSGDLDTASGGQWGGNGNTIYDANTNLTYPGYKDGGGGSGTMTTGNTPLTVAANPDLLTIDNVHGDYYVSLLLQGRTDYWVRAFSYILQARGGGNTIKLFDSDEAVSIDSGVATDPGTHLIVMKIVSKAGNDEMGMVVNPDLSGPTALADLETGLSATIENKDFAAGDGSLYFQFSRPPGGDQMWVDEVRWGTSLAGVTPEPASMTLLAMGGLAMLRRRR